MDDDMGVSSSAQAENQEQLTAYSGDLGCR
jgi:hypothetical protein